MVKKKKDEDPYAKSQVKQVKSLHKMEKKEGRSLRSFVAFSIRTKSNFRAKFKCVCMHHADQLKKSML
jgi:hypothetical protein